MTMMVDNPFVALTFISGPAILTNACAIMQNSATIRYSLAIPQWRELRASLAVHSDLIDGLYADPDAALALAERRIRLPLGGLNLLYAGVGLFGLTSTYSGGGIKNRPKVFLVLTYDFVDGRAPVTQKMRMRYRQPMAKVESEKTVPASASRPASALAVPWSRTSPIKASRHLGRAEPKISWRH